MTSINERQIDVLNGLISITMDSAEGYDAAARDAGTLRFKGLFHTRASQRRQLAADLQDEVRRLGGEPKDGGSLLAAGHRLFLNLKNAVTGSDDSVINEVESGEDHIKDKFECALQEGALTAPLKAIVSKAYEGIKADHDVIRDLKHESQARLKVDAAA
jgi:uncharacterized protein (TIGR02284 family)